MATDDSRRSLGQVISVAADRLIIELHRGSDNFTVVGFDDIHYVARLGSFVMIPVQSEYVVAEVVGLRERDPGVSRSNRDIGELDKASSAKYLDLVPVGTLPQKQDGVFRFGVSTFPSLYADALYAFDSELDRIFEVADSEEIADQIGEKSYTRYKALATVHRSFSRGTPSKCESTSSGHVARSGKYRKRKVVHGGVGASIHFREAERIFCKRGLLLY